MILETGLRPKVYKRPGGAYLIEFETVQPTPKRRAGSVVASLAVSSEPEIQARGYRQIAHKGDLDAQRERSGAPGDAREHLVRPFPDNEDLVELHLDWYRITWQEDFTD